MARTLMISARKSLHLAQSALGSVVSFQVVNSPSCAVVAHNSKRPSESGATATAVPAAGSGPTSARKSLQLAQSAFGLVVSFQVVNSPPCAVVAHSSKRPSESGPTATAATAPGSGPISARKSLQLAQSAFGSVVSFQ